MNMALEQLAATVDEAARSATEIAQLSHTHQFSLAEAYAVQALSINRRIARGERRVGVKMGFTSRAKMVQMGLSDLIWGRLTDGMRVLEGSSIEMARYVHPRVEPEVAYLLNKRLTGVVSNAEALACVEAVAPALEIIDSRYKDFKFSLEDVVADNSSSSGFVIGNWQRPTMDLSNLGLLLELNGRPAQIGSTAAILGDPVRSLVEAARICAEHGEALEPGWVVMAGGATAAEYLAPGMHVRCSR
jgi:2-oxo-3-hexenedioate decarboxylase